MIERFILKELIAWKDMKGRKPLVLRGVRQCGKTWLLKEFGKRCFDDIAYFNFEQQNLLADVFAGELAPKQILLELSTVARKKIEPEKTLIIFDEIQECPRALTALKYFCEECPEYAVAAAGSLLGITLSSPAGFPVGKVSFLDLTPCSFEEYLRTVEPELYEYAASVKTVSPVNAILAERLTKRLNEYLVLGGMPAVLSSFIDHRDIQEAETIQDEILRTYELDFSKHAPTKDIPKLFLLWKSIPAQLARENVRFVYGEAKVGARAKDLEDALRWLQEAGLVCRVSRIEKPESPLAAHEDRKSFKLYLTDTGLLRRLAMIPAESVLINQDIFREYKGRLAENFVLQQLTAAKVHPVYYWTSGNMAEVDFVIQQDTHIIPVEVKSGLNVRAQSLKVYRDKYTPDYALRFSMQNLKKDDGLLNIPLYLIGQYRHLLMDGK